MNQTAKPIRVLLVEDNPGDSLLIQSMLEGTYPGRYAILRATNLQEARAAAAAENSDVVLLDLTLPDSTGLATLDQLHADAPSAPIIVMTGLSDEDVAMQAVQRGAQDYLPKGQVNAAVVARSIRYAMDRRQAQESLRQSEERVRRVLDNLYSFVGVLTPEGVLVETNRAPLEASGIALEEVLGHRFDECYWWNYDPKVQQVIRDSIDKAARGKPSRFDINARMAEGRLMTVDFMIAPMRDDLGRITHLIPSGVDVTDRRRVEEALRRAHGELDNKVQVRTLELAAANQTLRMISECNEALVRATDEFALMKELCQIIVNMGGYRLAWVGYAEDDPDKTVDPVAAAGLEKSYLDDLNVTWSDTERGRGPTGTAIRTGQPAVGRNFAIDPNLAPWREVALKHGFQSSIALPLAAGGRVFGALTLYAEAPEHFDTAQITLLRELADDLAFGIMALRAQVDRDSAREISDQRAKQLQALAMELTRAEHRERQRLARFLHDHLQQLLVGAKFNVTMLRAKAKTKTALELFAQLSGTLDEAIRSARSLTAELSPPVLHEKGLAAGLEWLGRQMEEKHGLAVAIRAESQAEPATEQMRLFLYEAVRELLFNVVKHAGVRQAEVALARSGNHIHVTVADGGAGFDPNVPGPRTTSSGGFGLFSIRERLEFMGGQMETFSALGQGSRFILMAPLLQAEPASSTAAAPAPLPPAWSEPDLAEPLAGPRKIRVILADDHPVVRQGIACLLQEQPGIEIVGEAGDGMAAIEMARRLRPDVVVMDVSMPRLNGVEATRRLSREMPAIRIVGLSMHDAKDMAPGMLQAGAAAFLTKGGPMEDLIAAIRACRDKL
jgi:PAS domain S-box-containing protein